MTNRKTHTRFRLVPKSTTLDDLEGPLSASSVSKHMRLSEPTTKIWMKIDPYCQWRRCSAMTVDSDNIRFMWIFRGFPWEGASTDSVVIENIDFRGFRTLHLWHLRKWSQHYYIVLFTPCRLSTDLRNHDLEWPWMVEWPFYVKFSQLRTTLSYIILHTYCRAYL